MLVLGQPDRARARQNARRGARVPHDVPLDAAAGTVGRCAAVMTDIATKRASWDEYFMVIARQVASRATCDRKQVGAVIVRYKCILATRYN